MVLAITKQRPGMMKPGDNTREEEDLMPYHIIDTIALGPLHIRTWGSLVGLGLLVGALVANGSPAGAGSPRRSSGTWSC